MNDEDEVDEKYLQIMDKINSFHIKKNEDKDNSWLIDRLHPDRPGVFERYLT